MTPLEEYRKRFLMSENLPTPTSRMYQTPDSIISNNNLTYSNVSAPKLAQANVPTARRVKQGEPAMQQAQVQQAMFPAAQPAPTVDPETRMRNQIMEYYASQQRRADELITGKYSPSRDAYREWAKQMVAATGQRGMSSGVGSAGRANQRAAGSSVPMFMAPQVQQASLQDKLTGQSLMSQALAGQGQYLGNQGNINAQNLSFQDWMASENARQQLLQQEANIKNYGQMLENQLNFQSSGIPGYAQDLRLGIDQFGNKMNNINNVISGTGNLLQNSLTAFMNQKNQAAAKKESPYTDDVDQNFWTMV